MSADADVLRDWLITLCDALELDPSMIDRDLVLDLARDAAHGVARPAAPLTTFLVGLAAGRDGAGAETIAAHVATAGALATHVPANGERP